MSHGFTEMQANRPLCLGHHRKLSVCVLFGRRKLSTCALSCTCFPWTKGWPLPELQETPSENVPQSSTGRRLPLAESLHRLCATAGSCFRKGPRLFPLVPSLHSCRIPKFGCPAQAVRMRGEYLWNSLPLTCSPRKQAQASIFLFQLKFLRGKRK